MEAVGSLAAGVAHDLNNILSGLVGYPDLLLLEIPEGSPLRTKIKVIKQSGQRAAAVVQDMLTLARRGVANREIFCPNRIIQEYLESPEFAGLKEKHPQIEFDSILSPDLLNVKGSPLHLSKGLMNLVINAAEALPAGGRVVISSANSYLDTARRAYEEIPEGEYALHHGKNRSCRPDRTGQNVKYFPLNLYVSGREIHSARQIFSNYYTKFLFEPSFKKCSKKGCPC